MNNTRSVTLAATNYEKTYDVIVVGGGTAGAIAAIAAAESGKDVLIVERGYSLGGSATMAQVTPFMTVRIRGDYCNSYIGTRLQRELTEKRYLTPPWEGAANTMFSPVMMAVTLEEMCVNAGIEILYGAAFVDTVREGASIKGVLVQTVSGLLCIEGAMFIDCTGDAQVAFTSGCPYAAGDPEDHDYNQNMSLRFAVGDIDIKKLNQALYDLGDHSANPNSNHAYMAMEWKGEDNPLTQLFKKGLETGELLWSDGVYFQVFAAESYGDHTMYFNCPEAPHCRHTTDAFEVSQGVIDCRASAMRIHQFLKKHLGGFENSTIIAFAQIPGVRESRRIEGEYLLSVEDYNDCRKFKDGIAQSAYPIDVHGKSELVHPRGFAPGEFFEIPYKTLVAKGIDNLLVAGRCISATFWAQSAIRIQLVCHALGEAAGIAASMALDLCCAAKTVDGAAVRAEMIARGGTFAPVE